MVSVYPYISEMFEGMRGSCSPKDLETFLQLAHMYFTEPRKDEKAFASMMSQIKTFNSTMLLSPGSYFRNEVNKILYKNHPRRQMIIPDEELDALKLEDVYRVYKERFSDASDFTFFFVGNFKVEEIEPMLATYLGGLPATNREESWKDVGINSMRGITEKEFRKGKEPKSQVVLKYMGDFEWKAENRFHMNAATQVLRIMMRESMREDKGGVYGVGVYGGAGRDPKPEYELTVSFTCDPKDAEDLISYCATGY